MGTDNLNKKFCSLENMPVRVKIMVKLFHTSIPHSPLGVGRCQKVGKLPKIENDSGEWKVSTKPDFLEWRG